MYIRSTANSWRRGGTSAIASANRCLQPLSLVAYELATSIFCWVSGENGKVLESQTLLFTASSTFMNALRCKKKIGFRISQGTFPGKQMLNCLPQRLCALTNLAAVFFSNFYIFYIYCDDIGFDVRIPQWCKNDQRRHVDEAHHDVWGASS